MLEDNSEHESRRDGIDQDSSIVSSGRSEDRKISRMGRRGYLKYLSSIGVATAGMSSLTKSTLAKPVDNPEKEIPIIAAYVPTDAETSKNDSGAREAKELIKSTRKDRWFNTQAAEKAADRLQNTLEEEFGSKHISVSIRGAPSDDGHTKKIVAKRLTNTTITRSEENGQVEKTHHEPNFSLDELKETLPSQMSAEVSRKSNVEKIRDIPVIGEADTETPVNYYDEKYRPVPGGCRIHVYNSYDADYTLGTAGELAYSEDRNREEMITAGHMFYLYDKDKTYEHAQQPGKNYGYGDNRIGERADYKYERENDSSSGKVLFDAGTFSEDSSVEFTYSLAESNNEFSGYYSWDYIANDMCGNTSETVIQQGTETGRTTGYVKDTDASRDFVTTTANVENSDSGGPIFTSDTNQSIGVAITSLGADYDNNSNSYRNCKGNAVESIFCELNLQINESTSGSPC